MSTALAPPGQQVKRPARDIVLATRMPPPPERYGSNPFTTLGDVVAECQVDGCGYCAQGERAHVGLAIRQHHRMFHPNETSVVLLNHARQ